MPDTLQQWLDTPAEGTLTVDLAFQALKESFVSGDPKGQRIRVRYYVRPEDRSLVGKAVFGSGAQGPPDHAHGGSMAALLDDAMGGAAWIAGYPVVAVNLNVTFRRMLPLHTRCLVETRIKQVDGRKIGAEGRIVDADSGQVFSEGQALFVVLDASQIETMSPKARAVLEKFKNGQIR